MNNRKNLWVWVGIVVVVIIIIIAVVSLVANRGPKQEAGTIPVHAPVGQVVEGFPQQLILGAGTTTASSSGAAGFLSGITNSYSINYSTSTNGYTAEWLSSSTVASLYSQYDTYVTKNGWTIKNHGDFPTLKSIFATNASAGITIAITAQSQTVPTKGSKVTVSYVTQ